MKLITKKKFFDEIKNGVKVFDFRDAHITFVCEETKETLQKKIISVNRLPKNMIPENLQCLPIFEDNYIIIFGIK